MRAARPHLLLFGPRALRTSGTCSQSKPEGSPDRDAPERSVCISRIENFSATNMACRVKPQHKERPQRLPIIQRNGRRQPPAADPSQTAVETTSATLPASAGPRQQSDSRIWRPVILVSIPCVATAVLVPTFRRMVHHPSVVAGQPLCQRAYAPRGSGNAGPNVSCALGNEPAWILSRTNTTPCGDTRDATDRKSLDQPKTNYNGNSSGGLVPGHRRLPTAELLKTEALLRNALFR